jgi:hypothetical protein
MRRYLRTQFQDPQAGLPSLLEDLKNEPMFNEPVIRDALKRLDAAWELFTEWTQAHTLFTLVDRATLYLDKAGIKINLPAVLKLIRELVQTRTLSSDT